MARPNPLADPEFAQLVAQSFVDGLTREQMCEKFGRSDPDTITRWRRDPRVKSIAMRLIEDRVFEVTRKVDGKIAHKLANDDLTVVELLAIRKEFLGGKLREQTERADEETAAEAQAWLEQNPEASLELEKLLRGGGTAKLDADAAAALTVEE